MGSAPSSKAVLRLVDHDRAAGDRLRIGRVHVGWHTVPVVEDNAVAVVAVSDHDPELVHPAATGDVTVIGRQREVVARDTVDRPAALVLRLVAGDDEPVVTLAMEVEVP